MTGHTSGGTRLKALTNVLAAIAMVVVYFMQAFAISGLAATATATPAEAGRRGRRGRRGRGRGRRGGRRGRGCPWWMWDAGLCW